MGDRNARTRLLALILLLAAAFVGLTVALLTTTSVMAADGTLRSAVTAAAPTGPSAVLVDAAVLVGQRGLLLPLVVLAAVGSSVRSRCLRPALVTGAALGGLTVVVLLLKQGLGRTAPASGVDAVLAGGASYPSGHAAGAVLSWGLLVLLMTGPTGPLGPRWRRPGLALSLLLGGVAAVGVVLKDYHWSSDAVAGVLVGALALVVAARFLPADPGPGRRERPGPMLRS